MRDRKVITCNKCNTGFLYWFDAGNGKYRLQDEDGILHNCGRSRSENKNDTSKSPMVDKSNNVHDGR